MERSPVGDWQELSALYEEADGLDAAGCAALLERLKREQHPQAAALEQMLRARDRARSDAFLDRLPSLPSLAPPRPGEGSVAPGDRFGPYSIVRRLGSGGMAQVWLAERDDGAFQRHVAIKLPYRHAEGAQRETLVQRFARERDILAALHHPNIAALHDAGVTPAGQPWLALEMVEGESITDWCDRQRLPVRERVRLFRQVLRAVQHAHANLVIHRDLKPANILVTPQGNVRLLDFGIAKLIEPLDGRSADSELTREGGTPLTLQYASPEQISGLPLTTACDVYALGVVLYELLAGVRPYEPKIDSAAQIEQAIVEHEPRAPSRRTPTPEILAARSADAAGLRRSLAPDLDAIVLHALAKQPQGRYPSAEALLADLDRWLGGQPVSAQRPSAWYWLRKFVARNRLGVALGAGAVVSLIAAATVAVVMGIQARQESARAVAARDFLLDMFRQASPELNDGREISARQMLEIGQAKVAAELGGQPILQTELLQGLGEVDAYLANYVQAEAALGRVADNYRAMGQMRNASLAQLELAGNAYAMGDHDRARTLLEKALATHRNGLTDDAFAAKYWSVHGWLAEKPADMRDAAQRSFAHAQRAFGRENRITLAAVGQLASAHADLQEFDSALATLRVAEDIIVAMPGNRARELVNNRLQRGTVELSAGKFSLAAEDLGEALRQCERLLGVANEDCGTTRIRRAVALLALGDIPPMLDLLPQLLRQSRDTTSPRRQAEAQVAAYRILAYNGTVQAHSDIGSALQTLAESGGQVQQPDWMKVSAAMTLAEGALRQDDPTLALRHLQTARLRVQKLGLPTRMNGRIFLLEGIAQQMLGRHEAALDAMRAAHALYVASSSAQSPIPHLFRINQVRSLQALGRADEAEALRRQCEQALSEVMARASPTWDLVARLRTRDGTGGGLASRGIPRRDFVV